MELSMQVENTSGQGINSVVPDEVKNHFNWGALCLTWIWGLGNNTFITLIIIACLLFKKYALFHFILTLGLGIWFGIKGNEWAWRNKKFESVEKFHSYQKKWAIAALIIFVGIPLVCVVLGIMSAIFGGLALHSLSH